MGCRTDARRPREARTGALAGRALEDGEAVDRPTKRRLRPSTSACRPSTSSTRPRTRPTRSGDTPQRRGFEIVRTYADEGKSGLRHRRARCAQAADRRRRRAARPTSRRSWSTTSAAGAASRTPTRAPTTSTSASAPASPCTTAPSSSRTTAARSRPSSRASSAPWPASTAASSRPRSSPASAADRAGLPAGRRRRVWAAAHVDRPDRGHQRRAWRAASTRASRPTGWSSCRAPTNEVDTSSARSTARSCTTAQPRRRSPTMLNARGVRHRLGRAMDAGHGPPDPDQREVHRQQRLEPRLLQAQEEAGPQRPGHVGPGGRRASSRSSTGTSSTPPRRSSRARSMRLTRRGDARRPCTAFCSSAGYAVRPHHRRSRGHALEQRIPISVRQPAARLPAGRLSPRRDYRYIEINRALRRLHPGDRRRGRLSARRQWGRWRAIPTTDLLDGQRRVHRLHRHRAGANERLPVRCVGGFASTPACSRTSPSWCGWPRNNEQPLDYYLLPRHRHRHAAGSSLPRTTASRIDAYRFETSPHSTLWPAAVDLGGSAWPSCPPRRSRWSRSSAINVLNPRVAQQAPAPRDRRQHRRDWPQTPITVRRRLRGRWRRDTISSAARDAWRRPQALGPAEIPAVVIEASENECLVMSLVENIARREHRPIDMMQEIGNLASARLHGQADSRQDRHARAS